MKTVRNVLFLFALNFGICGLGTAEEPLAVDLIFH